VQCVAVCCSALQCVAAYRLFTSFSALDKIFHALSRARARFLGLFLCLPLFWSPCVSCDVSPSLPVSFYLSLSLLLSLRLSLCLSLSSCVSLLFSHLSFSSSLSSLSVSLSLSHSLSRARMRARALSLSFSHHLALSI